MHASLASSGAAHMRYTQLIRSLRLCPHGHGRWPVRATHGGMANGMVLTFGCEQHMWQWVQDRSDG